MSKKIKERKIKVFLGGYINQINAQNINCLSLSTYLDKQKFIIYTLTHHSNEIDISGLKNTNTFHCFFPRTFSKYLGFFWGIWHCDVAYLPKGEAWRWNHFWLKSFRKKSFATVESILNEEVLKSANKIYGGKTALLKHYNSFDKLYSITDFMRHYNREKVQLYSSERVLHLGVDADFFFSGNKTFYAVDNVIMIGNDLVRKGVYDYFYLAEMNPAVIFHLVGSGNGKVDVEKVLRDRSIENVIYHGALTHTELKTLFKKVQLHILPSRSEGFPKIVLEAAAAGVPSCLYKDYGAEEWLQHGINGFLVENVSEIDSVLRQLIKHPEKLCEISADAQCMAKKFDWKNIIYDWEQAIEELV